MQLTWCVEGKRGASSVFSVDIDSSGTRLASGGLDGTIRIWSLAALRGTSEGPLLAAMTRHTGAIMSVRWSTQGDWLATGADDQVILLWRREEQVSNTSVFDFDWRAAGLNCPVEQYRVVHRLTEHTRDVTDLAWSPDGTMLASCSLDGTVLIHELAHLSVKRKIEGLGFVKGLAWSPDGMVLAVQSDARELRVFSLAVEGEALTALTWPFREERRHCPDDTFFRRPSWSPDGLKLALANAFNGDQPCALIVDREHPDVEHVSMIGHAQAVDVVRFSPRLYGHAQGSLYLLAVGSEEGTLSLWSSLSPAPLAVLDGLFREGVMDVAWTPDGQALTAASYDGTMAFIKLNFDLPILPREACQQAVDTLRRRQVQQAEIQLPASVAEVRRDALLKELMTTQPSNRSSIETQPIVQTSYVSHEPASKPAESQLLNNSQLVPPPVQTEVRTKEGKRRITPVALNTAASVQTANTPPQTSNTAIVQMGTSHQRVMLGSSLPPLPKAIHPEGCSWSVECVKGKLISSLGWEEKIPTLSCLLADAKRIVVIQEGGKCLILGPTGRHLSPWISLGLTVVYAQMMMDDVLLVIMASGEFRMLQLPNLASLAKGSLAGIAVEGASIVELKPLSSPLSFQVRLSNGAQWAWVADRELWVDLDESAWQLHDYSQSFGAESEPDKLLSVIRQSLREGSVALRQRSLSYLEHRLALCRTIGTDESEFIHWATLYAQRLNLESSEASRERWLEFLSEISDPRIHATLQSIGPQ